MSKRKWHHPDVPADQQPAKSWRTFGELAGLAPRAEKEREFPVHAEKMKDEQDREMSRRSFVQLMGASTALAGMGLASCRRPESYIVPFANAPEWVIPGKPTHYASAMPSAAGAIPLVVTTYEGRPTKVEPNTLHLDSSGTDAMTQASVLNLYSPSRSRTVLKSGEKSNMEAVQAAFAKATADLKKVAVLTGSDESPTRNRLLKQAGVQVFSYEAISGPQLSDDARLVVDFEKADRILSFDCDFVGLDTIGSASAFFDRRKGEGVDYDKGDFDKSSMNRLYIAEPTYSLTGGMADHRLRLKPSQVLAGLAHVAKKLGISTGAIAPLKDEKAANWFDICLKDLKSAAGRAVVAVGSRYPEAAQHLALAINEKLGSIGSDKPVHAIKRDSVSSGSLSELVAAINSGKVSTVLLTGPSNPSYDAPADLDFAAALVKVESFHLSERADHTAHAASWHIPAAHYLESWSDARSLTGIYTLIQPLILPLYGGLSEIELVAALTDQKRQLVIEGAADGKSSAYLAIRETFNSLVSSDDAAWKKALKNGYVTYEKSATASLASDPGKLSAALAKVAKPKAGLELVFSADYSVLDGRYAENGWLQETPDPITKVTWDNAAAISPQTAKDLGIFDKLIQLENSLGKSQYEGEAEGENFTAPMINVLVNGASVQIPVVIGFGQADGVVALPLGYGQGFHERMRKADIDGSFDKTIHAPDQGFEVGLVARNSGFNVYPLRSSAGEFIESGAKIELTSNRYKLALVQEHHSMYGRALAREISTVDGKKETFEEQLDHVKKQGMDSHAPENISLYVPEGSSEWWKGGKKPEPLLNDNVFQWGMTIDLNVCNGCNACLVACQAENNIPIVGKKQVSMGREMHWIRMDRYFAALPKLDAEGNKMKDDHDHYILDEENPEMIPQPVACVQCESAPCETVCPVNATVHTEDGLNAMAYNRCIGTRYCANNCPYKARRFNFFDYNKRNPLLEKNLYKGPFGEKMEGDAKHLQKNPNVSVRMRGVMEKCTYCVQRLKSARIKAKSARKDKSMVATSTGVEIKPEDLRAPANSVKVACQEACSAGAISFGNLLMGDKEKVNRAKASKRNYDLLHYIGTRPRTSYLARVKNPNEKMPDGKTVGTATINMH